MSSTKKSLGVVIIGVGRAGGIHLKNVVRDYTLSLLYVIDERISHVQGVIDTYNQPQCKVLSPDNQHIALNDPRVDFVMVCSPTFVHEKNVLDALNAGKGVFCEKPIADNEESVARCYDTAAEKNLPLFCSFNRRFDPSLRSLYNQRDEVGQMQMIKSCARDSPFPPLEYLKISGGVYHDCLVHDIDLICWVAGEWPSTVYSSAHSFCAEIGAMGDVDTVAAVMKFPSGKIAIIDTSRDAKYGYDQRLEIFGSKGMLANHNQRPNNLILENENGASTGRMFNSFHDRYELSYIESLRAFSAVLRGEAPAEVTKEVTINVSKIASCLEESSKTGQEVKMVY